MPQLIIWHAWFIIIDTSNSHNSSTKLLNLHCFVTVVQLNWPLEPLLVWRKLIMSTQLNIKPIKWEIDGYIRDINQYLRPKIIPTAINEIINMFYYPVCYLKLRDVQFIYIYTCISIEQIVERFSTITITNTKRQIMHYQQFHLVLNSSSNDSIWFNIRLWISRVLYGHW